jgi:hypothetical protein
MSNTVATIMPINKRPQTTLKEIMTALLLLVEGVGAGVGKMLLPWEW